MPAGTSRESTDVEMTSDPGTTPFHGFYSFVKGSERPSNSPPKPELSSESGCRESICLNNRATRKSEHSPTGGFIRFSAVGALGAVLNLVVMAVLVHGVFDMDYPVAAAIAAEISIMHNFILQERFVFPNVQNGVSCRRLRLTQHLLFNNAEALVRLPFLMLLVQTAHLMAVVAQAVTLAVAFVARFIFISRVVYRQADNHQLDADDRMRNKSA